MTTTLPAVPRHARHLVVPALLWLSACGSGKDSSTIDVAAASSLAPAFESIIEEFRSQNPGVEVRLSTAGSATLVTQIQQGSEADVVALADLEPMDELVASGDVRADDIEVFATNTLAILVAKGNPLGIASLADLVTTNAVTVMCDVAQPCGRAARTALEHAGVELVPASLENGVSGVVQKVEIGEADAGLVYVSDGRSRSNTVDMVEIPDADNVVNSYPLAVTVDSDSNDDALAFVEFVRGKGGEILREFGFGLPPS